MDRDANGKATPAPMTTPSVYKDLRARNKRRERVAKLLEPQRQQRIERGYDAPPDRWTRDTP